MERSELFTFEFIFHCLFWLISCLFTLFYCKLYYCVLIKCIGVVADKLFLRIVSHHLPNFVIVLLNLLFAIIEFVYFNIIIIVKCTMSQQLRANLGGRVNERMRRYFSDGNMSVAGGLIVDDDC